MNYKLTDEERDRIRNATETNSPHDRLDGLAE